MLDVIFVIAIVYVIVRLIIWGAKATWCIAKVVAIVIMMPLLLVGLVVIGLFYIAFGLAIIMVVILTVGGIMGF